MENLVIGLNKWQDKRVLITGHSGFKGSWLAAWLQMLGANVYGISLEPNTTPNHFELLKLDIESHFIDIRDAKRIDALIKQIQPEIIFHLAAQPLVRESYRTPLETLQTNIIGTANILNSCRNIENLKGVVVVTSDKCYENREQQIGYHEEDPMGGHDPYSVSKGCAELVTASFRNSFFNLKDFGKTHQTLIASARAGNVVGGGDWAEDRLIPDIIRASVKGESVFIRNPQATRPWQHVLDCISGYVCLASQLSNGNKLFAEAWNFGPNDESMTTVLDVVYAMHQHWNKISYKIDKETKHPHEANLLKLDCSKAKEKLGWQNVWNLKETIKKTANWYREFYDNHHLLTYEDIKQYEEKARALGLFAL